MKRLFLLLACVLLPAGFIFAGGQQQSSGTAGAAKAVSLVAWVPGNTATQRNTFLDLIAAYEKANPNVKIQYQQIPWTDYFTKLNAAFAGNAAPDLFGLGYGQAGPVYANGQILELNSHLQGWSGWTDIPKNILAAGSVGGKLYAIMMPDIKVFWYRTDLFKQAGLDPTQPPSSIAMLKEYAAKLTQKVGGQTKMAGIDISTSNGEQSLAEYILMFKDQGLWDAQLKPLWDTPTSLDALNLLNGFIQTKESFYATENNVGGNAFQNGLAAMHVQSFGNRVVYDQKLGKSNIAFGVQPGGLAQSGATFLAVYSHATDTQAAVDLLKYFTSTKGEQGIFNGAGFIPTRESNKQWFISQDPAYAAAWKGMENARTYGPMNQYFFDAINVLRPALESVYYNKATAQAAMSSSAAAYLKIVEKGK